MNIYPVDEPPYAYYHRCLFRIAAVQCGHSQILAPAVCGDERGKVLLSLANLIFLALLFNFILIYLFLF